MFDTINLARVSQGQRVLDLGCGPGYFLSPLVKQGALVTAVDYSEKMLGRAREALFTVPVSARANVEIVLDDAFHYLHTVPDGIFDIVIASLFVSYYPEPETIVSQIFRVLRPGGRLVMSNPVPRPHFAKVFWRSGWAVIRHLLSALQLLKYAARIERFGKIGVFHFFNQNQTRDLLLRVGFDARSVSIVLSFADTVLLSSAIKPSSQ
jgi:SAM-dependent methyltransferase